MAQQGLCILVLWSIVEREREEREGRGESRDEGETDNRGKPKGILGTRRENKFLSIPSLHLIEFLTNEEDVSIKIQPFLKEKTKAVR